MSNRNSKRDPGQSLSGSAAREKYLSRQRCCYIMREISGDPPGRRASKIGGVPFFDTSWRSRWPTCQLRCEERLTFLFQVRLADVEGAITTASPEHDLMLVFACLQESCIDSHFSTNVRFVNSGEVQLPLKAAPTPLLVEAPLEFSKKTDFLSACELEAEFIKDEALSSALDAFEEELMDEADLRHVETCKVGGFLSWGQEPSNCHRSKACAANPVLCLIQFRLPVAPYQPVIAVAQCQACGAIGSRYPEAAQSEFPRHQANAPDPISWTDEAVAW